MNWVQHNRNSSPSPWPIRSLMTNGLFGGSAANSCAPSHFSLSLSTDTIMSFSSTRILLRANARAAFRTSTASALPAFRQQSARRGYASEAGAAKGGNGLVYGLIGAALVGGGAYYAMNSSGSTDPTEVKDAAMPKDVSEAERN